VNPEEVRRQWSARSGEYSPDYYAYRGAGEASVAIRERLDRTVGAGASVLEPGCSSGRHLAHLLSAGYRDLHGIEINEAAFEVMTREYPALADAGTFHADAMETVVPEFEDDRFDAVYSVQTLQHVHPEQEWLFAELARVAGDRLITVEIESPTYDDPDGDVNYVDDDVPLYYRDWGEIFTGLDMLEIGSTEVGTATLREFRSSGS